MIYLPAAFPCACRLRAEGHAVSEAEPPRGVLRVLLLNLMPQKEETEYDIARALAHDDIAVALLPMKIAGQTYKTTPEAHMRRFYRDFETYAPADYDGLVVTGAPLEQIAFEDVRYWRQLQDIMDWAAGHVRSTLYICWGAQAALYHRYGIPKRLLPRKCFGIFPQTVYAEAPLMRGLSPVFPMPVSRHTEIELPAGGVLPEGLGLLAASPESGAGVLATAAGREVYVSGHLEYAAGTLHNEYRRDLSKGLPIDPPVRYYDAQGRPCRSWREACRTFYRNWLLRCCRPASGGPDA